MRKVILNSAVAMAMGSVSFAGLAAESASLSVVGDINPATCDVSLSSASIDIGTISASTLTEATNIKSGPDITVSVACDAAASVALQVTDNRTSSAMTLAEINEQMDSSQLPGMTDAHFFGLGTDTNSEKIGALIMAVTGATTDGTANANMLSSTDRATWTAKSVSPTTGMNVIKDSYLAPAADAADTAPVAFQNATFTVSSAAVLKKADMYPSGENVNLDGNVTFSIVYL